ncbi:polysaccharide deacetylase family protein [Ralstonia sp. ASV6]|uniref:polysaccharide deacetylase family protein n=1 Tax=Ralstonia sp. ASV6 TaxID=2795124 RepID=UPI0018EADFB2|nr:polysaccharide deacetylase family protein [Ralstonia sp. ASV6]
MIGVLFSSTASEAGNLVLAALRRSVTASQAWPLSRSALRSFTASIVVAVDVPDEWGADLLAWMDQGNSKLVVFGRMPSLIAQRLQCRSDEWPADLAGAARSQLAASYAVSESRATVRYRELACSLGAKARFRPFERFDFADEWNNLGYGAIRVGGSIWGVAQALNVPAAIELASVFINEEQRFSYAALWDSEKSSLLWFNRPVGPIDSFEWRLVENFLSAHRTASLPCQPVLSEIPWGYDAVITSRLDCDEDVESARPLWKLYQRLGIPFTLAVHTSNLSRQEHHGILQELVADGGAVLSHTATHAPNWGGSYQAAFTEADESARLLQAVTGKSVRYAVSPFHQSPFYALQALADAGYAGCIGGIIRNDPEFLIARGGTLAGMPIGFVGHSQQCMLHGDCMLAQGDPLAVFKEAFDLAFESRTLFGYLDHPFSERYQYGWPDEATRVDAHDKFIAYIRHRATKPLFLHEEAALDFLQFKSAAEIVMEKGEYRVVMPRATDSALQLAVEFHRECQSAQGWAGRQ